VVDIALHSSPASDMPPAQSNGYRMLAIEGGTRLNGYVDIGGAKNAALPIIAATLLTADECVLQNVPDLSDVHTMCDLLASLGAKVEFDTRSKRLRSTAIARARFWICDFSSCIDTTIPVGLCVIRTAESVVLTDCPPGPEERKTSIWRSAGSMWTSTSSASGSTTTVAEEVWTLPWDSVTGTRWTRCGPASCWRARHAPSPATRNVISE